MNALLSEWKLPAMQWPALMEAVQKHYQPDASEESMKEQSRKYEKPHGSVYRPSTVNASDSAYLTENLSQDEILERGAFE